VIAACAPAPSASSVSTPAATLDTPPEDAQPSALEDALRAGSSRSTWETMDLTNAETGATFTLADFPEKTVYIELMATWCTNCRAQQREVRTVREQLGETSTVYISLSVEPNDTTEALAEYRVRENFPWIFAVAPPDMMRALITQFGQTVTNPTSTPHLVISPSGSVSQLATGIHSAEQLVTELTAAAGA
jgi:thiol-disulfide isomerase/thioredoxin